VTVKALVFLHNSVGQI